MDAAFRCGPGGILGLVDLIDEHRGAFDYDWRSRFGLPVDSIGADVDWREAVSLTRELMSDPSSRVWTAVNDFSDTWTREGYILADLFDVLLASNSKNPRKYPRPTDKGTSRLGRTSVPQEDVRAALRSRGHDMSGD